MGVTFFYRSLPSINLVGCQRYSLVGCKFNDSLTYVAWNAKGQSSLIHMARRRGAHLACLESSSRRRHDEKRQDFPHF